MYTDVQRVILLNVDMYNSRRGECCDLQWSAGNIWYSRRWR